MPYNVGDGSDLQKNGRDATSLARLNRYAPVLRSYCSKGDPICAGGDDVDKHLTLFEKYTEDASNWTVVAEGVVTLPEMLVVTFGRAASQELRARVREQLVAAEHALVSAYLPIILPFAAMALPVLDLLSAYVRRTLAGRLWFQADKQHLHHRMLHLGHGHRAAVALLWLWSAVIAFGVVLVGVTDAWWSWALLGGGLVVASVLTFRPLLRRAGRG